MPIDVKVIKKVIGGEKGSNSRRKGIVKYNTKFINLSKEDAIFFNPFYTKAILLLSQGVNTKSVLIKEEISKGTLNKLLPKLEKYEIIKGKWGQKQEKRYIFNWDYIIDKRLIYIIRKKVNEKVFKQIIKRLRDDNGTKKVVFDKIDLTCLTNRKLKKINHYLFLKIYQKVWINTIQNEFFSFNDSHEYLHSLFYEYFKFFVNNKKFRGSIDTILERFLLIIATGFIIDRNKKYKYPFKKDYEDLEWSNYIADIHYGICQTFLDFWVLCNFYYVTLILCKEEINIDYNSDESKFVISLFYRELNKLKHPQICCIMEVMPQKQVKG